MPYKSRLCDVSMGASKVPSGKHVSTAPLSTSRSPPGNFGLVRVAPMTPGCDFEIPETLFLWAVVVVAWDAALVLAVLPPVFPRAAPTICMMCPNVMSLMAPTFEMESLGFTETALSASPMADVLLPFPPFSGLEF